MADFSRRSLLTIAAGGLSGAAFGGPALSAPRATEITELGGVRLAAAIRARKISCVEAMTAHLDQIERLNPAVNAIVALHDRGDLPERRNSGGRGRRRVQDR